jgi:DNA-nicking Smr family endonuclease
VVKKTLTPEDSDLFRQTIGKVRPVNYDKILLNSEHKPKPYPKKTNIELACPLTLSTASDLDNVGLEDSLSYTAPNLQTVVLKKLRKGYFGLDAEIDLHGLTSNTAKQQLLQFLHDCTYNGCRCVHIIHGKGYRSADQHPVLKNNLNLWLRQHQDVLAFCSASPKDGGTGAVFVLLRLTNKYSDHDKVDQ